MYKLIAVIYISAITVYNLLDVVLKYINKNDTSKIEDNYKRKLIVSLVVAPFITMIYIKYLTGYNFIRYFLLMMYLILSGYIDCHSENVYTFISNTFLGLGMVLLVIGIINENISLNGALIAILSTLIVSSIFALLKGFAWGDVEVFTVTSVFLCNPLSFMNIFLALAIAGIGTILKLCMRKVKLKDSGSLCEYIAISTYLFIIFLG